MKRTSPPHKRKAIQKRDIQIDISEKDGSLSVRLKIESLSEYDFPKGAKIFLEAYNKMGIDHLDFGAAGDFPKEGLSRRLPSFEAARRRGIKFRLKAVDMKTFRMLGLAERLKERKSADSLLPLETDGKISSVFKIYWEDDSPLLLVNQNLAENLEDIKPAIAEAAFREILLSLLYDEGICEKEDIDNHKWIQFAKKFKPAGSLADLKPEQKREWLEGAVEKFSKKSKIIPKLKRKLEKS